MDAHSRTAPHRCTLRPAIGAGLLAALLACIVPPPHHATEITGSVGTQSFQITTWDASGDLASNVVNGVVQAPDGYLWVGTETGLLQFDGVRFRRPGAAVCRELSEVAVQALLVARDGSVWAGTDGCGAVRVQGMQSRVYRSRDGLPGDSVRTLAQDAEGALWVGGDGEGVARLRGDRVERFAGMPGQVPGECTILCPDPSGGMWVGNSRGVALFRGGTFQPLNLERPLSSLLLSCLYAAPGGELWIGTHSGLIRRRGGRSHLVDGKGGLLHPNVYFLAPAPGGDLWVGTYGGGLQRFSGGEATGFSTAGKLGDDRILCLCEDREGGIWVGTRGGGLSCLRPGAFQTFGVKEGLGGNLVYPVLEDRRGNLWAGTVGGGLARIASGIITRFTGGDGLGGDSVHALFEDVDGSLWVGLDNGTLAHKSGDGFTRYTFQGSGPVRKVSALHRDAGGTLWVGTRGSGVWVGRGGRFERRDPGGEEAKLNVHQFLEDPDGGLWVASSEGLWVFRDGRFERPWPEGSPLRKLVFSLHRDAAGALWVGTYGNGVVRVKAGAVARATAAQGLAENIVYKILEDSRGTFWMSGNRGISSIPRRDLEAVLEGRAARVAPKLFGAEEGLPTSECDGGCDPAGCVLRSGELCFPTAMGLVLFHPDHIRPNRVPPPIVVEEVLLNGRTVTAGAGAVPQGRGNLEIRYIALSLANPGKVRFRYTLEGYDRGWVEAGERRAAYYTNLPAGHYRFRVAACNADGVWSASEASLRLQLRAPFYRTPAFILLLAALLASAVWGAHVLRVRLFRRRSLELESRVAERTAQLVAQNTRVAELEELYRAIVEDQVELVCRYGTEGTLTFVNGSLATFARRPARDLAGTDLYGLLPVEAQKRVREHHASLAPDRPVATLQVPLGSDGQGPRILEWTTRAFFDGTGAATGYQSVGRDITWRLRMERSLIRSQRMEAMGQLAGGVAHDVNNLLQAMRSTAATLKEARTADPSLNRAAGDLQVDIERCSKLVRQLLLLGPRETPKPQEMDLGAAVAEMDGLLRRLPREGIQLLLDLAPEPLPVLLDPGDLEQVLVNLILNASDAMPRGGRILLRTSPRDEGSVSLTVSDTGEGIHPAVRPHIFDPFFTTRGGEGGTGLGLAVVRGVVERNEGAVEVESQVGCGSAFKVTFPRGTGLGAPPGASTAIERGPSLRGLNILVVEDEPEVREWLGEALEMLGCEVTSAGTVAEAEAAARRVGPRAVLSDFLLPDGSGAEFVRRLREGHPEMAAVLASGYTAQSLEDGAVPEGVGFLKKPFSLDELERALVVALEGVSSRRPGP